MLFCLQLIAQDLDLLIVYSVVHFWRVNFSSLPAQCKFLLSLPPVTRNWGLWVTIILLPYQMIWRVTSNFCPSLQPLSVGRCRSCRKKCFQWKILTKFLLFALFQTMSKLTAKSLINSSRTTFISIVDNIRVENYTLYSTDGTHSNAWQYEHWGFESQ